MVTFGDRLQNAHDTGVPLGHVMGDHADRPLIGGGDLLPLRVGETLHEDVEVTTRLLERVG